MNGKAPTYLEDLFRPKETNNQIELRGSMNKLAFPLHKIGCYKQSINYKGPILWNNLATSERIAETFFSVLSKVLGILVLLVKYLHVLSNAKLVVN